MFDDFVKNLSDTLATGKMDGYYDFHISKLRDMTEHNRQAHIMSMKHSQKHDYKADIRLVITESDDLIPGADPWLLKSYTTPGIDRAAQVATQIVIRRDGQEKIVKDR